MFFKEYWKSRSLGYKVTTCTSPVEAQTHFSSNPEQYDLLISDTIMPELTGDELAQECLKIRPALPVILCTGYTDRISYDDAMRKGIKACLYKPIAMANLAKTVREAI